MTAITIDTGKKSACLDKLINGINWKYNSRYWTSGLRSSARSFQWCSSNGSFVDPKLWLDQEPSNTNGDENCAQLVITKSNSSARLNDNHCGRINAFACQLSFILFLNLLLKCIIRIPILILHLLNRDPQHQNLLVKRPFVQTLHARKMFATPILFMTHSFEIFLSIFQNELLDSTFQLTFFLTSEEVLKKYSSYHKSIITRLPGQTPLANPLHIHIKEQGLIAETPFFSAFANIALFLTGFYKNMTSYI
jgi:hypothetical protein